MRGELGRVNFHKDLWDCYQGQGKQIGQKPDQCIPINDSTNNNIAGHIWATVFFSLLKLWMFLDMHFYNTISTRLPLW